MSIFLLGRRTSDRTSVRLSTVTEVGSSSPFSVNWTPTTLPDQTSAGSGQPRALPGKREPFWQLCPTGFVFTLKHGSWLNLVESFFSKVVRTLLRGVTSKEELVERIQRYIDQINKQPVVFKWTYKMDDMPAI